MNRLSHSILRCRTLLPRRPPPPHKYASPLPSSLLWYTRFSVLLAAHGLIWTGLSTYLVGETFPFVHNVSTTLVRESDDLSVFERVAGHNDTVRTLRADPDYEELKPRTTFSGNQEGKKRLTTGLLSGNGKIQFNRVWVDRKNGSTVSVLGLGRSLCGFPGVIVCSPLSYTSKYGTGDNLKLMWGCDSMEG
jgi:hypothetical protein